MGCAGSKPGGEVPAVAPVAIPGGDSGNMGIRDPPSSTSEEAGDNGPDIATLMQQNQEMMRLFLLSQAATQAPSTTAAAPVVVAPHDGGGGWGGGGEVDGGEEGAAARTVLPSSRTVLGFRVEDGLLGSDSSLEEQAAVSALDAVFYTLETTQGQILSQSPTDAT